MTKGEEWNLSYLFLIRMDFIPRKLQSKLMRISHKCTISSGEGKQDYLKVCENLAARRKKFARMKERSFILPPSSTLPAVLNSTNKDLLNFSFEKFLSFFPCSSELFVHNSSTFTKLLPPHVFSLTMGMDHSCFVLSRWCI